jgi:hypothetical protein
VSTGLAERVMVEPAHLYRPPASRSLVEQVTRVCASAGRVLDEEQRLAVEVCTGLKADGTPAALEAAVISARQNLKTYALEGIALTLLLDPNNRVRLGIWSAQEFDTAQETFRNFADLFESPERFPHLARRVKTIRRGSGKEEIELVGGRRLKFKARSGKGARGLTGDFVVLDEAFALDAAHMGALLPTLSTRRRAMVFYGSSAGMADSEILRGIRDRGRKGGRGAPAYVEWCAPGSLSDPGCELSGCTHAFGVVGCSLDREDFWLLANPAMGRRITVEYIGTERSALPVEEFARERLGWWDLPSASVRPLSLAVWATKADPASQIVGAIAIGADVAPGRASASIAVAGRRADGKTHAELIRQGPGTDWLAGEVARLAGAHELLQILDGKVTRPAIVGDKLALEPLLADFTAAGIVPVLHGPSQLAAGCARLQDAVESDALRHLGQEQISDALTAAVKRDVGDGGWAWGKRLSAGAQVDISGLVALTEAHSALVEAYAPVFFASRR